ncbi:TNT domain-containing protein [Leifsonia shinshuensis]|uniref:TNT domain-containing protein n=1 Tax=Leifsonia shinshuensis TaxID=150026 RepID=UPI0029E8873A|nr:TNT domain-containing protein [Leifsonia shinshuensis]
MGKPVETTLEPGTVVDRYGDPTGSYVAPDGTPFSKRGLPSFYETQKPYYPYEAVQPVIVRGGAAATAFGGGGGVQFQFGAPIQDLARNGILKALSR